jgi:PKD repeat protein
MKKTIVLILLLSLSFVHFGQVKIFDKKSAAGEKMQIELEIADRGIEELRLNYAIDHLSNSILEEGTEIYSLLRIEGFAHTQAVGKPALPAHQEIVAVPVGATARLEFLSLAFKDTAGFNCYPAQAPLPDCYGEAEASFTKDSKFYELDVFYPEAPAEIINRLYWRGMELLIIQIRPVLYNPALQTYRLYSKIDFSVSFTGGKEFIEANKHSEESLLAYSAPLLNRNSVVQEIEHKKPALKTKEDDNYNYIIITIDDYFTAAEQLANWKRRLGYAVEIVTKAVWTSTEVKEALAIRYQNYLPKPDYYAIIGDHQDVPGEDMGSHVTDLYYGCMDGPTDYLPEMARGRISVVSNQSAHIVVNKIINYESNPPLNSTFYSKATHAAQFQESATPGYAERRFAQTSEEILTYMQFQHSFAMGRVYVTGSATEPTNWNDGSFSAGESIPNYLLKPGFPWNGNAADINSRVNSGSLYLLHRDHGYDLGWGDPHYDVGDIDGLNNGEQTPVVFSINCLTGKFDAPECFTEKFLRHPHGGAVGIFGHAEVSYSGFNDGLAMGLIDAIWSTPGLIPNFTGSGGVSNPNVSSHAPILTLGHVLNHSLVRMTETWGESQYSNELFHLFGDPAMKIWSQEPTEITATYSNTVICNLDSVLEIFNASVPTATVTFVLNNKLIAATELVNGSGTLEFEPLTGSIGYLTISADNCKPFSAYVFIIGDCPVAEFDIGPSHFCTTDSVWLDSKATGNITSYLWDFGDGAIPPTASSEGPHTIYYNTPGIKTISYEVSGPTGTDTHEKLISIDADCKYSITNLDTINSNFCYGVLTDDGGSGNYNDDTYGTFIIEPESTSGINLYFTEFNFEEAADTLYIYDGYVSQGNLIGSYTGLSLPNGGVINSTSGVVTVVQRTNSFFNESGFRLEWSCSYPNSPPHSSMVLLDVDVCLGDVVFSDISTNNPSSWEWHFGDGNTSTVQNPTHEYMANGIYTVTLITQNTFGADTAVYPSLIEINRPLPPVYQDSIENCGPMSVTLSAISDGITNWFDSYSASSPIATGPEYSYYANSTKIFYVENEEEFSAYGAKYNNAGDGDYYTDANSEFLVFDVDEEFTLKSVKVYADGGDNRMIELWNSSNTVLETITTFVPNGEQRVELNWVIPPGTNYKLIASTAPNLFYNNISCSYPYDIAGFGEIKQSSCATDPTGFYYFFYDWEVIGGECYSARLPFSVFIFNDPPDASFTYNAVDNSLVSFSNTSLNATSCLWHFGDNTSSTSMHPNHSYTQMGYFDVTMIAYNACGSDTVKTTVVGISDPANEDGQILVYPNPAENEVNIVFIKPVNKKTYLSLYSITGQHLSIWQMEADTKQIQLDVGQYSTGIYWLKIGDENIMKLVIQ